nr:hypothetical protein BaRGS_034946 [Batillaria attramentaria]
MASTAGQIGLKISSKKTKHMRMNNRNNAAITVNGEALEEVEYFTYLGSKMTTDGDSEKEVRERILKASQAFASLKTIWRTRKISTKTKLRLFKSNVLSTLLYGAESWKMTKGISHKLEVFQNRCLRRILSIFWPNTISNSELHERTNTKPITLEVRARRWRWIGHVLRMPPASLPRIALRWTPDGRRKRGRPKETWRRTVEREMKEQGWTWNFLERYKASVVMDQNVTVEDHLDTNETFVDQFHAEHTGPLDTLRSFHLWFQGVHGYASIAVSVFGITANLLNITVLTSKSMRSPTNLLLTWMAVTDMLTMAPYVPYMAIFYCPPKTVFESPEAYSYGRMLYMIVTVNFVATTHTISIWIGVCLAAFRAFQVKNPNKGLLVREKRMKRVKVAMVSVYVISTLILIPGLVTTRLEAVELDDNVTVYVIEDLKLGTNETDVLVETVVITYAVIAKLIPCILMRNIDGIDWVSEYNSLNDGKAQQGWPHLHCIRICIWHLHLHCRRTEPAAAAGADCIQGKVNFTENG